MEADRLRRMEGFVDDDRDTQGDDLDNDFGLVVIEKMMKTKLMDLLLRIQIKKVIVRKKNKINSPHKRQVKSQKSLV